MAILIPSKNIYGISDNNKVLDNKITSVSIETNKVVPNNQYSSPLIHQRVIPLDPTYTETNDNDHEWSMATSAQSGGIYYACAYRKEYAHHFRTQIKIPTEIENGYIDKLYRDAEEGNIVEYTLYGDIREEKIQSSVYLEAWNKNFDNFSNDAKMSEIQVVGSAEIQQNIVLDFKNMEFKTSVTNDWGAPNTVVTATAIGVGNTNNITAKIENNKVVIDLYCFSQFQSDSMSGISSGTYATLPNITIEGTRRYYTIKQIDVTVFGNTIGIKFDNSTNLYGSSEGKPINWDTNELFQYTSHSENIANSILWEYKNGKETAIIKCSIGEYYYDDGNFALSTKRDYYDASGVSVGYQDYGNYVEFWLEEQKPLPYNVIVSYSVYKNGLVDATNTTIIPKGFISVTAPLEEGNQTMWSIDKIYTNDKIPMTFVEGDVVIPYIMGANGYEEPISAYNDGTAKSFQVVGTNIYYDGAVWQELTLQEV